MNKDGFLNLLCFHANKKVNTISSCMPDETVAYSFKQKDSIIIFVNNFQR